jgi:hypothetical protein
MKIMVFQNVMPYGLARTRAHAHAHTHTHTYSISKEAAASSLYTEDATSTFLQNAGIYLP